MGGKPSKGTRADRRLSRNKDRRSRGNTATAATATPRSKAKSGS